MKCLLPLSRKDGTRDEKTGFQFAFSLGGNVYGVNMACEYGDSLGSEAGEPDEYRHKSVGSVVMGDLCCSVLAAVAP